MSVIFVVEEAFLACLSDFCLIFHSFVKKKFLLSILVCPQPHQSPRIFDNCSIIPSDLVFSLKLLHQLQNFFIVLVCGYYI